MQQIKQWEDCLEFIKDNLMSPEQFSAWFEPLTVVDYRDGTLTLYAPSEYFIEQLEMRYLRLLSTAIRRSFGSDTKLIYKFPQVSNDPSAVVTLSDRNLSPAVKPFPGSVSNPFYKKPVPAVDSQLNPRYTFENYVGSPSNRLARSIGEAIATNVQMQTFNPFFVFGPTGVGKTHLIQAIGIRIKEQYPDARVLYLTARLFESQFTTAICNGTMNDFIHFYQTIDVLIIDDIQDFADGKKDATQNAFFHIFNHLHQNGKKLIMSSDCRPSELAGIEQRLLTRFKWGATAELERPDLELRRDILVQRSRQDGLEIPAEVLDLIANTVTDSVRTLEGVMVSLLAHATVLDRPIDIDLARTVLSNAVKMRARTQQVNFEQVAQQVSAYYDIDPDLIFTKTRKREISDARQMVMFLAKKHAKMPLAAIGTRLDRTHATVLYACRNIEERLPHEKQLRDDVAKIEATLLG